MKDIQTLHSHTTQSDGLHSHLEVMDICKKYEIGTIAFTDHDSVMSQAQFKQLKNLNSEVKWISGIEISSGLPKELGGGISSSFHITGLFVDPTNLELQQHCKLAQEARIVRMQKIVKNLQGIGFKISEQDCLKASGGEAVGRPHIVAAINMHAENKEVMEALRLKMEAEANVNPTIKNKFDEMMERGEMQYPYVLFLSDDSYIPGIYVEYQYWADMDKSVSLIRNAGGAAFVAHYFTIENKIPAEMLGSFFQQERLDGIETVYGLFGYGTKFEEELKRTRAIAEELANKYDVLRSGGADAHSEADFREFAESLWYSEETEGMAQDILAAGKTNKEFSNF